ncbi:SGNH/GDSL hydrolase family protein [Streptosporangium sp. 'caverna']|uniref:SGNH/GDSL hydrolase family protein n=1 Tax=Streptosporangium sp. 'caverna' TaxID=2202249 RepID=UPI000D7DEFD3|nr:SGNH/GDSL hydrolase family protein [Streptosporangium sp. 'caverna']AWS44877.1 acylhydrolase [Streptosporangium sp. 'caverna']
MDEVRESTRTSTARQGNWIATWGTAQQLAQPAEPGGGPQMPDDAPPPGDASAQGSTPQPAEPPAAPTEVSAQTVRMVARATVGGTAVRVALSNSFGYAPVRIDAAQIARHDSGSAIRAGSARNLTFGGRDAVVLPTGAQIYSDPIEYDVPAQTDLVVSLYIPDEKVTPTTHEVGLRTAWLAPGNQAATRNLRNATGFQSYLWLAGIDVLARPTAATIVAFGDSITDGAGTTPDADTPWPSLLARRLAARQDLPPRAVINMGIAGNRVLRETDGLGAGALARFDRDVLARPGVRWVVLSEGGNDICFGFMPGMPESERATAEDIIAGYRMLIGRAHLHDLRIIGCTITQFGGTFVFTAESERMRQDVNRWIRGSGEFDAVVDLDAATRDLAAPTKLRTEFDSGDNIHPNDAGNQAIAEAFDLELFRG